VTAAAALAGRSAPADAAAAVVVVAVANLCPLLWVYFKVRSDRGVDTSLLSQTLFMNRNRPASHQPPQPRGSDKGVQWHFFTLVWTSKLKRPVGVVLY
jgi:hypothetical protein